MCHKNEKKTESPYKRVTSCAILISDSQALLLQNNSIKDFLYEPCHHRARFTWARNSVERVFLNRMKTYLESTPTKQQRVAGSTAERWFAVIAFTISCGGRAGLLTSPRVSGTGIKPIGRRA